MIEKELYGPKGSGLVNSIERKSGFILPLPDTFTIPRSFGHETSQKNQVWREEELAVIERTTGKLPSTFMLSKKALLGVFRGRYSGVGGVSAEAWFPGTFSAVAIITPEDWNLQGRSSKPRIWRRFEDELAAKYIHEVTHQKTVRNKGLINRYAQAAGWQRRGGRWAYESDESFVIEFMRDNIGPGFEGPEEDIAVASMFYVTAPRVLTSKSKPDRNRFLFLSTELYAGYLYY